MIHGCAFINAFVQKDYRKRFLFEFEQRYNPKSIEKGARFLGRFNHAALKYLDPRFVTRLEPPNSDPLEILKLLKREGASNTCHAISTSCIDNRTLPLSDALAVAVGWGMPSIISCVPGQLVYLETEQIAGPPDRYILIRK